MHMNEDERKTTADWPPVLDNLKIQGFSIQKTCSNYKIKD